MRPGEIDEVSREVSSNEADGTTYSLVYSTCLTITGIYEGLEASNLSLREDSLSFHEF